MRLHVALLGALVVPVLPLVVAAPAHAALGTICVGPVPAGTACNTTRTTIPLAIADATSGDLIRVGPGAYTDGPYVLPAGVSLRGSGAGTNPANATVLTLTTGSAQTLLTANNGTVANVRVAMTGSTTTGLVAASGSTLNEVVVFGQGVSDATGLQFDNSTARDVTVNVTGGSGTTTAVKVTGGTNNTLTDSTWNGGVTGYLQTAGTATVQRVTVNQATTAVSAAGGTLNIDDAVLDLGATGQTGLRAQPTGGAATATANGNHLTVVGGAGGSRGVAADATGAGTPTANVTLSNSIVRGPTTSLVTDAGTGTVSRSAGPTTRPRRGP